MLRLPRVIAVFLIGLICFSITPIPAQAVEIRTASLAAADWDGTGEGRRFLGDWKTFYSDDFNGDVGAFQMDTACTGQARWRGEESELGSGQVMWSVRFADVECWRRRPLAVPNPGDGLGSSAWTSTVKISGVGEDGNGCGANPADAEEVAIGGSLTWNKFGFKASTDHATGLPYQKCTFKRWEFESKRTQLGIPSTVKVAGDFDLGAFPDVPDFEAPEPPPTTNTGTCPWGTPQSMKGTGGSGTDRVFTSTWGPAANSGVGHYWSTVMRYQDLRSGQTGTGFYENVGGSDPVFTNKTEWIVNTSPYSPFGSLKPIGALVRNKAGTFGYTFDGNRIGRSGNQIGLGVTDASKCIFWFGPKLWDDGAAGGSDEPMSVMKNGTEVPPEVYVPPVDEDPEETIPEEISECNFDIASPSTWLEGGICSAVGLLGALLNAILGLPGALLDAIGDFFVPNPDHMASTTAGLKESWGQSSPGEYFNAFGAVSSAFSVSAGPCSGPTIGINFRDFDVDMQPMNACGGVGATVATVSRAAIGLSVVIGTAYAVLRLIGASMGLNLNALGRGD